MEDFINIYGIESPELEQLDGIADDVFSTNETRRKIIPPPPPADPLQDQSMDIPLDADGSYQLIAFGDRKAWPGENGRTQEAAWMSKNSPDRQHFSAVVRITETSAFDSMEFMLPTHVQAELLDVTGTTPSRVALLGSMADDEEDCEISVTSFQSEFPLPQAVAGMEEGFTWTPYGKCLESTCEVWWGNPSSANFVMFAFVLSLSPLMENTIPSLVANSRRLAMRLRYADGLSRTGWPAWHAWSQSISFTINSLPPVPYNLMMIADTSRQL